MKGFLRLEPKKNVVATTISWEVAKQLGFIVSISSKLQADLSATKAVVTIESQVASRSKGQQVTCSMGSSEASYSITAIVLGKDSQTNFSSKSQLELDY